jgi:hypothetical protein
MSDYPQMFANPVMQTAFENMLEFERYASYQTQELEHDLELYRISYLKTTEQLAKREKEIVELKKKYGEIE